MRGVVLAGGTAAVSIRSPVLPTGLSLLRANDLVAETAWMQGFAPVENALIAAGFAMSEIKLQPSSTGKIIVSNNGKAAFLEFSD